MERQVHIILNVGGTGSCLDMSIVSLIHTYHEPSLGTCRQATNRRKFENNITIKDWRKVVHFKMLDTIIVNLFQSIPRTL
jgi:hypothetical protein